MKIKTKEKFNFLVDLTQMAQIIENFYGLDVEVRDADFNPAPYVADFHVVTPNGKTVVKYHVRVYTNETTWSIGGQEFVTSGDMRTLHELVNQERKK